ncbi:hypothetical protein [Spirosoma oryzicola]|uniref:hypothetical protein n=1 Tax=Spirosoma oryzicola TaxID=2898794 RepID=UPI001E2AC232|nr:hypothetical protein [Spirosoma oryzicola]UHG91754.1 hypothetical protein LQ777_02380 [Spirosoma oryzicola]
MNTSTFHPEFKKAFELGHVEPVALPNGEPFIIDGHQFYQAANDGTSMYQGRAMSFTDVIEKHDRLKLDEATIRAFFLTVSENATQAMKLMNNDPEQALRYLSEIMTLAGHGKQRLDLYEDVAELGIGSNTARIYELSSIWFFLSDEDPAGYDPAKGERNVKLMLKRPDLYDFFLRLRLNQFAPLAAHSAENTLRCMKAIEDSNFEGLLLFTQTLLNYKINGVNPTTTRFLESLTATLRVYDSCYVQLWKNLTTTWPQASENSSSKPVSANDSLN